MRCDVPSGSYAGAPPQRYIRDGRMVDPANFVVSARV